MIHNETVRNPPSVVAFTSQRTLTHHHCMCPSPRQINVWTHLLGALYFAYCAYWVLFGKWAFTRFAKRHVYNHMGNCGVLGVCLGCAWGGTAYEALPAEDEPGAVPGATATATATTATSLSLVDKGAFGAWLLCAQLCMLCR